jgi:predicted enzyme related to lactoylglutathione lyase
MTTNAIHWFEIFVSDIDRACRFYEKTLGLELHREELGDRPMAVFPAEQTGVAGGLVQDPKRPPSDAGAIVYFDANGKLDACIDRVRGAGGTILMPKTDIGEPGFIALVRDTEGNTVGLHSERVV